MVQIVFIARSNSKQQLIKPKKKNKGHNILRKAAYPLASTTVLEIFIFLVDPE